MSPLLTVLALLLQVPEPFTSYSPPTMEIAAGAVIPVTVMALEVCTVLSGTPITSVKAKRAGVVSTWLGGEEDLLTAVRITRAAWGQVVVGSKGDAGAVGAEGGLKAAASNGVGDLREARAFGPEEDLMVAVGVAWAAGGQVVGGDKGDPSAVVVEGGREGLVSRARDLGVDKLRPSGRSISYNDANWEQPH